MDGLERLRAGLLDPHNEDPGETPRGSRSAAVLILLCRESGVWRCLLTKRSEGLPTHAGQVSFPGGSREPADASLLQTALRETQEEIGLDSGALEVLGRLPAVTLPSGFHVTPFVALSDPLPALTPAPGEVAEIFTLPLDLLFGNGVFQQGSRYINNIKRNFYYIDVEEYYIWGATAAMLRELAVTMGAQAGD